MNEKELADVLQIKINELQETMCISQAVRPFVEESSSADGELIDAYVSHVNLLIQKSVHMERLIDQFLDSQANDRTLIDAAHQLLLRSRDEIAWFRGHKGLADLIDMTGDPDNVH